MAAGTGIFCRNNHELPAGTGDIPELCPICGVRMKAAHPLLMGVGTGFIISIIVSGIELYYLDVTNYASWGGIVLFGAPFFVLVINGLIGATMMRRVYGNTAGLGRYLVGTSLVVVLFAVGWIILLLIISIAECNAEC